MCTRFIIVSICLLTSFSSFRLLAQETNVIDEVVWVVGDEPILKSQVEEQRTRMIIEQEKIVGDPYCFIPEQMAIQKLYLNQAKIDSIYASEENVIMMVDGQMNYLISQIGSKEKMEEYFNKSYTSLREEYIELVRDQEVAKQVQSKITGDIKITPADVRKYYSSLPQDSLPYIPEQVEVQMIMFQPRIPIEETDRVRNQLRNITERVTRGESEFSALARAYSEDPESARRGGELGFMGKGQLLPQFANVAFNMTDPKKVSRIVETEYGFHIIQLIEKRGDRINCRHILISPKAEDKETNEALARLDSLATDLKANKFTFEEAALNLSQDKDTRNNGGLLQNPSTANSRFEMQQLPQEIAKAVDEMKVGEISKSFVMISTKTNKQVCVIVKLKNRIEGHKANIGDDFQSIKNIVQQKKAKEKIDNWIAKKQKETYIRINEGWRNCEFQYPGWVK